MLIVLWLTVAVAQDDPLRDGQWYLDTLGIDALHAVSLGEADVRVAVVDSAFDLSHPDLAAGFVDGVDLVDGDDDPSVDMAACADPDDPGCDAHGTAVAGIIGARANNDEGIVGLCPACSLVPVRLLGDGGGTAVEAFEAALDADAAVVNNSWGFDPPVTPLPADLAGALDRLAEEARGGLGAVVVVAAGNDDRVIDDGELCARPEVLCVSALDRYDLPVAYTNRGAGVDVAAPSATVTTAPGGYTVRFGGTSAAAPVVAGVVGWLLSVRPELTAAEARELVVSTARQTSKVTFDEDGHHEVYGDGILDPAALLDAVGVVAEAEPDTGCAGEGCASSGLGGAAGVPVLWAAWAVRRRRQRARRG